MKFTYYTLSYRTIYCEGKGDPACYDREAYLITENKQACYDLANEYKLDLIDPNNYYAEGFAIEEHVFEMHESKNEHALMDRIDKLNKSNKDRQIVTDWDLDLAKLEDEELAFTYFAEHGIFGGDN